MNRDSAPPPTLAEVGAFLDRYAPPARAEEWDHVGLQVGDPAAPVRRALVALDADLPVIDEARAAGAELLVTHHPLFFRPAREIRRDRYEGRVIFALIEARLALYSLHTNLDGADGGLCRLWAERLELTVEGPLVPRGRARQYKLAVFTPAAHTERVRAALCAAGAGRIGAYRECSFRTRGTGTFLGGADSNPFLGAAGRFEEADEFRLEVLVEEGVLPEVLAAMRAAHPYEEAAYDLYPLANEGPAWGLGLIGRWAAPRPARAVIARLCVLLGTERLRVAGDLDRPVARVGLCTGSGGELVERAAAAGCDLYFTGDLKYHQAQRAERDGLVLVDGGHWATEAGLIPDLAARWNAAFPAVAWQASVLDRDPFRWA